MVRSPLRFEGWQIDGGTRELRVRGRVVHVEPRVFDLLLYLAQRPGRVVSKQELRSQVWEGVPVSHWAVSRGVKEARRALGEPAREQLQTVRSRGFRLLRPGTAVPDDAPVAPDDVSGDGDATPGGRRRVPPSPGERGGRAALLRKLEQDLAAAAAGRGRLVLLVGEAGVGKSWLVASLLERARAQGALVLLGSAPELGPQIAYRVWSHALRAVFETRLVEAADLSAAAREVLLLAMPELADWLGARADAADQVRERVASARASFRLAGHLRPILARLGRASGGVVLALEDLHRADAASLDLLDALARDLADLPLLVVGTARDTEWASHPSQRRRLDALIELPVGRAQELGGLEVGELQRLIEAESGTTAPRALARRLRDWTGGNAFHALALLRARDGLDALEQGDPLLATLPSLLREGIVRHLRGVSEECRSLLALASVAGREFEPITLVEASRRPAAEVERLLQEAEVARLLEASDGRRSRIRFVHALLAEALLEESDAPALRARHEALADAEIQRQGSERRAAAVGHHLAAAGNPARMEEAIGYLRLAASQACGQQAFAQAACRLREARSLLDELREPRRADTLAIELDVELGESLILAHEVAEGRRVLAEAADCAARCGAHPWLGRAALAYAGFEETPGSDAARIRILELALRSLEHEDDALAIRVRGRLAQALQDDEDRGRRLLLARTAHGAARAVGEPSLVCDSLRSLHFAAYSPENLEEREQWAREELALARRVDDPQRVHDATMDLVADLLEGGDLEGVDRELDAHRRLLELAPELLYAWHHTHYRVMRMLVDGRLEAAERELDQARLLGERTGYELAGQWYAMQLYTLRLRQERIAELTPVLRAVSEATPLPGWQLAAALAAVRAGDPAPARDALRRHVGQDGLRLPRDHTWILSACLIAIVADELGAAAELRTAARALAPFADRHATLYGMIDWGPVRTITGADTAVAGHSDPRAGPAD